MGPKPRNNTYLWDTRHTKTSSLRVSNLRAVRYSLDRSRTEDFPRFSVPQFSPLNGFLGVEHLPSFITSGFPHLKNSPSLSEFPLLMVCAHHNGTLALGRARIPDSNG